MPDVMIEAREEPISELHRQAAVPSAFEASTVFDVRNQGSAFELRERVLQQPYRKDYDYREDPTAWSARFDVSNWGLIGAFEGDARVGGVVGAFDSPDVHMLEERNDLLVLWDLRVSPAVRRQGVGSVLFRAMESWARARRCHELKVETQNTNVAACKFYARQGCRLRQVNHGAYADLPDELQLIWRKSLMTGRLG